MTRKQWNGDHDYRIDRNEPILEYLQPNLRIVECSYGSHVLESQNNMMLDCDHNKYGFTMPEQTQAGLEDLFKAFYEQATNYFPGTHWAMYLTKNGFRFIEVSGYDFDWDDVDDVNNFTKLGRAVKADMIYVGLCKRMKDFRLRISPKPGRLIPWHLHDRCLDLTGFLALAQNSFRSHAFVIASCDTDHFTSPCARYHQDKSTPFIHFGALA